MVQNKAVIRMVLVAVACAVVLGVGAMVVRHAITTKPGEMASTASDATARIDAPAITPAAPSAGSGAAAAEAAREASWREAREASIRMQQRLRAEQQARKSAEQEGLKNERCVNGQRMKRIENGWMQAGNC